MHIQILGIFLLFPTSASSQLQYMIYLCLMGERGIPWSIRRHMYAANQQKQKSPIRSLPYAILVSPTHTPLF